MTLLIDGYNLMYAASIVGGGSGPGGLGRSRLALLDFVVEAIDPAEIPRTTVVFDATSAPPGLPRMLAHRGLAVRFAADEEGADALIEELIRADSAPRKLTVVSSDHRLQRAARRRRAKAIDSQRWYVEAVRHGQARARSGEHASAKPAQPPSPTEVESWLRLFGDEGIPGQTPADDTVFPPGYGEDVLEEE